MKKVSRPDTVTQVHNEIPESGQYIKGCYSNCPNLCICSLVFVYVSKSCPCPKVSIFVQSHCIKTISVQAFASVCTLRFTCSKCCLCPKVCIYNDFANAKQKEEGMVLVIATTCMPGAQSISQYIRPISGVVELCFGKI